MKAKEYLQQAKILDDRINSKIDLLSSLNALATKATATITDMPHDPNRGVSAMENTVVKIIDLQTEINEDIDRLVDLKADIIRTVKKTSKPEYEVILEKRYLDLLPWERIAEDLRMDRRYMFRCHGNALEEVEELIGQKGEQKA